MKRAQKKRVCVVFNKARSTWNHLWFEGGRRHSVKLGTSAQLPTREQAINRAQELQRQRLLQKERSVPTVTELVEQYRSEKMPTRSDTRRSYEVWINNHILPRWGGSSLFDVQPRPVELWLESLALSPKSRVHIRGTLSILWDFAMWRGDIPAQRNPMSLVSIRGATKRKKKPRSLTVEEFQRFASCLEEPFRTMALLCISFGLRISEALALKWADVDWLNGRLKVERAIVCQIVDEVKTTNSQQELHIAPEMLEVLKMLRQATEFSASDDWIFASPVQIGRLPWSYDQVWRVYQKAAVNAGLDGFGTHALRHTYRSWLDAVGTSIAVQQKMMRHADIRTTMNVYGDVVTDEVQQAQKKVVGLVLGKAN